ncbi:MAG: SO2930 family diheme c-type cytochrome [Bacteroidota bacterium]
MHIHSIFKYTLTLLLLVPLLGFHRQAGQKSYPMNLSEYGFFTGKLSDQQPGPGVVPYQLNSPLFSDYAQKLRFIKLPEGEGVAYHDQEVLNFPVGTTIIKTFYYPHDARKPEKGRQLMETRLLIHEEEGWKALPYQWNEAQTEAVLEVAGGRKDVKWISASGKKMKLTYVMPNLNQCKGCHSWDGAIRPIGPSARQLNGDFSYETGVKNQLSYWNEAGMIRNLPDLATVPRMAVWNDPASGSLDERARAWLDINCAHCHNAHGPANTSGFFLDIHQSDPTTIGILKKPVAAGRGSGGFAHDIEPGKPEQSILVHRIASTDPGVMMPELGRKLVHKEGLDLIREWIAAMDM